MSWQPVSTGNGDGGAKEKKEPPLNRQERGGRDQFSRVLPQDAKRKEICQGMFWKRGGCLAPPHTVCCNWQKLQCCMQQCEIRTGGIIRSIMNESCHRRCFAWLASSARLSGDAQWSPALSLLAFQPVVRVCCYSPVRDWCHYFAMPGTCLEAYSLDTFDSSERPGQQLCPNLYGEIVHVTR